MSEPVEPSVAASPSPSGHEEQQGSEGEAPSAAAEEQPPAGGQATPEEPAAEEQPVPVTDTSSGMLDNEGPTSGYAADAPRSRRHVAFDPEVQVATVVFHKEKTQQEIDDEMDVFERLYTKPTRQAVAPVNPNTTADDTTATAADGPAVGEPSSLPAKVGNAEPAQTPAAPAQKGGRHVLPAPSVERRLTAELGECSFKPKITSIAQEHRKIQNWEHFVQLQNEWSVQQTRKNAENLKKLNINDGVGQLFDEIKRTHSKKIIQYLEKQHLYKSPQQAYKSGKSSALRSFMHQHDAESKGSSSYHRDPVVTDGAVFQRLHDEATVRDASIRVMEQTMIEKEARELFRPTTNESYWRASTMLGARTPSRSLREAFSGGNGGGSEDGSSGDGYEDNEYANAGSYFGEADVPIEEELLAKGDEYRRRLEARQQARMLHEEVHTFKPVMNPNSRRILLRKALEHEMEQDEDMWFGDEQEGHVRHSTEREEEASYQRPAATTRTLSQNGSEELILERRRDSHSKKPKATFDAEVFAARMQRRDVDRAQKLSALRRSLKLEEVSECTFRPSITQKSNVSAQRQRGALSFSPQSKPSPNLSTPKSYVSQHPIESFSPEEIVRVPAAQGTGRRHDSSTTRKAPGSTNEVRQQRHHPVSAPVHHDGDAYLQNLEDELRGVIAEWTTISATTTTSS
jgi:hypothetical protein